MKKRLLTLILSLFVVISCKQYSVEEEIHKTPDEKPLTYIKLAPPFNARNKEYSGLTWYKDNLVLLPQYMFGRNSQSNKGYLFTLKKSKIESYLENPNNSSPLKPDTIEVYANGLTQFNVRGSGYESIGFIGNNVYLTIESIGIPTETYLIKGKIDSTGKHIDLDSETLTEIPLQVNILNIGYETLVVWGDKLIVIDEANGANVSEYPKAYVYDENLHLISILDMPHIEYRVTDATYASGDKFYVTNYFWTGDRNDLKPAVDSIALKFGLSESQSPNVSIERILPLRIVDNKIIFSGEGPIYWKINRQDSRNWEGVAKLDDKGFLIITDTYPTSILGFVQL